MKQFPSKNLQRIIFIMFPESQSKIFFVNRLQRNKTKKDTKIYTYNNLYFPDVHP